MSLESDLYAVLSAVCARVYPDVAPTNTTRPYCTWQQVGGQALTYLERAVPDKRNAEVQVNVWSATRSEANALMLQIEAAMTTATAFQSKPVGAMFAVHDEDVGVYGAQQDFSLWGSR